MANTWTQKTTLDSSSSSSSFTPAHAASRKFYRGFRTPGLPRCAECHGEKDRTQARLCCRVSALFYRGGPAQAINNHRHLPELIFAPKKTPTSIFARTRNRIVPRNGPRGLHQATKTARVGTAAGIFARWIRYPDFHFLSPILPCFHASMDPHPHPSTPAYLHRSPYPLGSTPPRPGPQPANRNNAWAEGDRRDTCLGPPTDGFVPRAGPFSPFFLLPFRYRGFLSLAGPKTF